MSDVLNDYRRQQLEWKLKFQTESPLHYVRQQAASKYEIVFCIEIPWPLLKLWKDLLGGTPGGVTYVDLINATVVDGCFLLKRDCERVEESLRRYSSMAKQSYYKTAGRKRKELDKKVCKLSIRRGEIESPDALKSELQHCHEELEEWKKKYSNLAEEKEKLYEEMEEEINKLEEEITDLKQVNRELADYVEALEEKESLKCKGRKISDVGGKQKGRKLRHIKNKAQCALWFCKSFGLELSQIKLKDEGGDVHSLNYFATPSASGRYDNLNEDDKNKVEQILFLLDKFCVGDEVYHELSSISEGLPKSYLIKQLRHDLNKTYHIERTPGKFAGAKINFTATLTDHIKELLTDRPELKDEAIHVKLSGDGARMSRTTNFMMFSFALLQQMKV